MGEVLSYFDALTNAMTRLGERDEVIFIGQGLFGGTTMSQTLEGVPKEKRLEMPIAEEMYTGMAIGMALQGYLPIVIIPRWNFMLRAADQIVNHLDRLPLMSKGGYKPKVIIRTAVPSTEPFNPGPQHGDDFTEAFVIMLKTVLVRRVASASTVKVGYDLITSFPESAIMVEYTELYRNARADG